MKVPPKRSIVPTGKRIASKRLPTQAEQADAALGATERQVVPLTPPSAQTPQSPNMPKLDSSEELTPG